jgi:hypothetical protein
LFVIAVVIVVVVAAAAAATAALCLFVQHLKLPHLCSFLHFVVCVTVLCLSIRVPLFLSDFSET